MEKIQIVTLASKRNNNPLVLCHKQSTSVEIKLPQNLSPFPHIQGLAKFMFAFFPTANPSLI